jgi:hypothetical protein
MENIPTGVRLSPQELEKFIAQKRSKLQTNEGIVVELTADQWKKLFSESSTLQNLAADLGSLTGQVIPILLTEQELNLFLESLTKRKEHYDINQIASLFKAAHYFDMQNMLENYTQIFA